MEKAESRLSDCSKMACRTLESNSEKMSTADNGDEDLSDFSPAAVMGERQHSSSWLNSSINSTSLLRSSVQWRSGSGDLWGLNEADRRRLSDGGGEGHVRGGVEGHETEVVGLIGLEVESGLGRSDSLFDSASESDFR